MQAKKSIILMIHDYFNLGGAWNQSHQTFICLSLASGEQKTNKRPSNFCRFFLCQSEAKFILNTLEVSTTR